MSATHALRHTDAILWRSCHSVYATVMSMFHRRDEVAYGRLPLLRHCNPSEVNFVTSDIDPSTIRLAHSRRSSAQTRRATCHVVFVSRWSSTNASTSRLEGEALTRRHGEFGIGTLIAVSPSFRSSTSTRSINSAKDVSTRAVESRGLPDPRHEVQDRFSRFGSSVFNNEVVAERSECARESSRRMVS